MLHLVRSDQRGVTVLELLIAIMLLAIALTGLAASFPLGIYGIATGGFQTTATLLAQESMEIAKNTPYDTLPSLQTSGFVAVPGYDGGFTRQITVSQGTPTAQTTTVTVVVRFTSGAGATNDTTIATVLAE